jgi:hypothetical protein
MLLLLDAPGGVETKTMSLTLQLILNLKNWPNGECRVERAPDEHDIACERDGFKYLYHGKVRLRNGRPQPHVTTDNGDTIMYDSWTDLVKAGWVLEGTL